jgi:hypothetical protein
MMQHLAAPNFCSLGQGSVQLTRAVHFANGADCMAVNVAIHDESGLSSRML